MRISANLDIRGKISKADLSRHKYGWVDIDDTWPNVFELITVDGFATSAALTNDHRHQDNFLSRELVMVDIDSGMTIPELLQDNFYNNYGAGFYATPSYTDELHKFRILFRLATPITDEHKLRNLNRALMQVYKQADQACKDPARLFYGTPDCKLKEITDNVLPDDMVADLVQMILISDEQNMKVSGPATEYKPLADEHKKQILDLLHKTYVGNYPIWRNVGWGLKQGGFTLADFQYVTSGMMNKKTPGDAKNVWDAGKSGEVTMGSVIHLLRQHHGEDAVKFAPIPKSKTLARQILTKIQEQQND